jgi:lysophospholipase L1-like esterase
LRFSRLLTAAALACSVAFATGCATTPPPVSEKVQAAYEAGKNLPPETAPAPTKKVAFIGDSYTVGSGAGDDAAGWANLLIKSKRWNASNFAIAGTGYVLDDSVYDCPGECLRYGALIPKAVAFGADVVIVGGGRNDASRNPEEERAAVQKFYTDLRAALPKAQIVALNPLWDSTEVPAELDAIAGMVKASAESVGGTYLDIGQPLVGRPELIAEDGVHPNKAGHQELLAVYSAAFNEANIAE